MKIDFYMKVCLTLIVLLLGVIAFRQVIAPPVAEAQSSLSGVQFSGSLGGFWLFDTRTGDVWTYEMQDYVLKRLSYLGRITKPGESLVLKK
jgi:hypothetical protein